MGKESWVLVKDNRLPPNAISAGPGGEPGAYVARNQHNSQELIPGKAFFRVDGYVGTGWNEHHKTEKDGVEMLVVDDPNEYTWVDHSGKDVPSDAVEGGYRDGPGDKLYVARAYHDGVWVPGKYSPSVAAAYVPKGGKEHAYTNFQILVRRKAAPKSYDWVPASNGHVPSGALSAGPGTEDRCYVARATHNNHLLPGKVIDGSCGYIPANGEHSKSNYEVFVPKDPTLFSWVPHSGESVPKGAVEGGFLDGGNTKVYVGRVKHKGMWIPGKYRPGKPGCLDIPYGGEHSYQSGYEILVQDVFWVPESNGGLPADAVEGGKEGNDTMYVGRADHNGDLITGKLVPGHKCTYIPAYGGTGEHKKTNYEALVVHPPSHVQWQRHRGADPMPKNAIKGGHEKSGTIYVARAEHKGVTVPGKGVNNHIYLPHDGKEHSYDDMDILAKVNPVETKP